MAWTWQCYNCGKMNEMRGVAISPFVRTLKIYPKKRPNREHVERTVLRAEFPGLQDAELGLPPAYGYDSDGTPIW